MNWKCSAATQDQPGGIAAGSTVTVRARNADGTYKGDDPTTPENEAWETIPNP
jgi:hypothetical protein